MLKVFEDPDDEVLVSSILRCVRDLAVADDTILSAVEIFLVPFIRYSNKCIADDTVVQVWKKEKKISLFLTTTYPNIRMDITLLFTLFSTSAFWTNVAKTLLLAAGLLVCLNFIHNSPSYSVFIHFSFSFSFLFFFFFLFFF